MEPKSNPMYKSAMTSGLIMGIALVIFTLIVFMIGIDIIKPPFWVSLINYIIMIGSIIYGTKMFRNEDLGGEISYSKALGFGVLVCVFAAIIFGIYMIIHMLYVDPDYLSKLMSVMEDEYYKAGFSEKQIEDALKVLGWMQKPMFMVIFTVFSLSFMGTIFSLVTSAFLKKEKPIFDNPSEPKPE